MVILNEALDALEGKELDGETVFKLYDTYGFPADLTNDVARERDFTIDEEGFEKAMEVQRQRAREAGQFGTDYNATIKTLKPTLNSAVTQVQKVLSTEISALFVEGEVGCFSVCGR